MDADEQLTSAWVENEDYGLMRVHGLLYQHGLLPAVDQRLFVVFNTPATRDFLGLVEFAQRASCAICVDFARFSPVTIKRRVLPFAQAK